MKPLYLVDGSAYLFRAYHALPPLTRSDGLPVSAVRGFTAMILRLQESQHDAELLLVSVEASSQCVGLSPGGE